MTMFSALGCGANDGYAQLVRELRMEFRCEDVSALADRIVDAEAAEFHWEARVEEHYLGQHVGSDCGCCYSEEELSRVAILSVLAQRWHVGVCLVDGEGCAVELLWLQSFADRREAVMSYRRAR